AYVMPAKLRDTAGEFLETQQKDFKIGFFNSKKKTEEVREQKLQQFLEPLLKTIDSTILWKLREKFVEILQENDIQDETLLNKAQQFSFDFGEAELKAHVKQGAKVNGNYILNYTNEVASTIKAKCRSAASQLWREIEEKVAGKIEEQRKLYEKELSRINVRLQEEDLDTEDFTNMEEIITKRHEVVHEDAPITYKKQDTAKKQSEDTNEIVTNHPAQSINIDSMIHVIDETTKALEEMPAFDSILQELQTKRTRLDKRELTIALFGAFSAGKSSFSNALFGEKILPVSPNPT